MKKNQKILIFIVTLLLLQGCQNHKIHFSEIEERSVNGKTLYFQNDKLFDGVVFEKYPNGVLKYETTIKDGEKNGPHIVYYKDGQLKSNYLGEYGNEMYKEYYENGQLKIERSFVILQHLKNNLGKLDEQRLKDDFKNYNKL